MVSYELRMIFAYSHPHWIFRLSGYNILALDSYLGLGFSARNMRSVSMRVKYDIWPVVSDHAVKMSHFSHWNLWNFTLTHFHCIASHVLPMSFDYPHPHWICRLSGYNILALDSNLGVGFNVRNVRLVWMRVKYDIWPVISDHTVKMSHFLTDTYEILLWLTLTAWLHMNCPGVLPILIHTEYADCLV